MGFDVDKWLEMVKDCQYLPETELKVLRATMMINLLRMGSRSLSILLYFLSFCIVFLLRHT